jgi:hypothetical protein
VFCHRSHMTRGGARANPYRDCYNSNDALPKPRPQPLLMRNNVAVPVPIVPGLAVQFSEPLKFEPVNNTVRRRCSRSRQ